MRVKKLTLGATRYFRNKITMNQQKQSDSMREICTISFIYIRLQSFKYKRFKERVVYFIFVLCLSHIGRWFYQEFYA